MLDPAGSGKMLRSFSKPTIGASVSKGSLESYYRSAHEQTGIFAGKGGFDIYVEKNTDLKGAIIASEAEAGKNRLSTGTFSFNDLENSADYSSKSIGAEYHHYGNYDKMSEKEKNKVYNTIGLSPSLSMPAKGDANSTTSAAVTPGTIEVRENPTQNISALNRDTENALNELGRIFDKQKIEEQQELAKVFGEEAFRLAHNLPDDGSGRKVAVHAIIGGIMSQITGAGFSSCAIGEGVNEAVIGEIKKIKDPGTAQIVSAIVGAAAAKAIGGNAGSGASAAASGTKGNAEYEELFRGMVSPEEISNFIEQASKDGTLPSWQEMDSDYYVFDLSGTIPIGEFISGSVGGILDKKGNVYLVIGGGVGLGASTPLQISAGFGNLSDFPGSSPEEYRSAITGLSASINGAALIQAGYGKSLFGDIDSTEISATSSLGIEGNIKGIIFLYNLTGN